MGDYRTMSFLPTIKCSQCSRDIAISQMGDHICGGLGGQPSPKYDEFNRAPYNPAQAQSATIDTVKTSRAMPPRVDTSAANRPFLGQGTLTPVSLSPSQSNSPLTPVEYRSPYSRPNMMRSATTPDVFSSNSESGYPGYSTSRPITPVGSKPREGGYGGFAMRPADDPSYAPVSPRMMAEGGLLKRMNSIAPGPFDINTQRKAEIQDRDTRRHQQQMSERDARPNMRMGDYDELSRPSTSSGYAQQSQMDNSMGQQGNLPRLPRKNGYEGFGPPIARDERREVRRPEERSQTFPPPTESSYSPPRKLMDPESRMRRPSNESSGRRPTLTERGRRPSGPDLSRPLPPRGASLIRPRTGAQGDAPALPNVNLAAEFGIGNPYHTPSTSQSSASSGYSQVSAVSSRTSPPKSAGPRPRRNPSDGSVAHLNTLMSEVQASMNDLQPRNLLSASPPPMDKPQYTRDAAPAKELDPSLLSPESPMDPAVQNGRFSPVPPKSPARGLRLPARPNATKNVPGNAHPARPTTSKGNCKGCREPIKGKSISSADGRLTGRYHKDCFVCATCQEPFQTSTFYVIDDAPYCERHYHKLNGSCCTTCDKGIEGQYLESERKEKYHPACLTCSDCRRTLRNDYFEMNGRVYCERDAFRRAQSRQFLGPNSATNRMERRTTRLMMM